MKVSLELGESTISHLTKTLPAIGTMPSGWGLTGTGLPIPVVGDEALTPDKLPTVVISSGAVRVEILGSEWNYLMQQMAKVAE